MQYTETFKQGLNYHVTRGFTMIEVMIVVAIIGILAAIAYPNYNDYSQKSRRADGHLALMQAVQSLERCKATNYSYASCTLPTSDQTSPEGHYTITLAKTAATYTVTATAAGAQVSDTDCTPMTLNHQGTRTPADASLKCWPK